jgi:hypothetical protein
LGLLAVSRILPKRIILQIDEYLMSAEINRFAGTVREIERIQRMHAQQSPSGTGGARIFINRRTARFTARGAGRFSSMNPTRSPIERQPQTLIESKGVRNESPNWFQLLSHNTLL